MPKTATLNANDLRSIKSVRAIKNAELTLIAEKPFQKITVEQIVTTALINIKTFYKYFDSKYDVLDSIRFDMLKTLQISLKPLPKADLRGGVLIFDEFLDTPKVSYHKLFTNDEYEDFFNKLKTEYFSLDFFKPLYADSKYPQIIPGYLTYAVSIYREWKSSPENKRIQTLDDLATFTADLLLKGLNGN